MRAAGGPAGALEAQDLEARDAARGLADDDLDVAVPPAPEALVVAAGAAVEEPVDGVPDAAAVLEEEDAARVRRQRGRHEGEEGDGVAHAAEAEGLQDGVVFLGRGGGVRCWLRGWWGWEGGW